ncbi:MAG: hypothetical protein ACI8WL_001471 [Polaribacter sp.]
MIHYHSVPWSMFSTLLGQHTHFGVTGECKNAITFRMTSHHIQGANANRPRCAQYCYLLKYQEE